MECCVCILVLTLDGAENLQTYPRETSEGIMTLYAQHMIIYIDDL